MTKSTADEAISSLPVVYVPWLQTAVLSVTVDSICHCLSQDSSILSHDVTVILSCVLHSLYSITSFKSSSSILLCSTCLFSYQSIRIIIMFDLVHVH
mgnify:CR=1 FL=1